MVYLIKNDIMHIKEMVYLNREAQKGLWEYIHAHDSMIDEVHGSTYFSEPIAFEMDDGDIKESIRPYAMGRIIDVEDFLADYPCDPDGGTLCIELEIEDSLLPWNDRTFNVRFADGHCTMTREPAEYHLKMGIGTFTTLLLGYKTAERLYELERIEAGKRLWNGWMTCSSIRSRIFRITFDKRKQPSPSKPFALPAFPERVKRHCEAMTERVVLFDSEQRRHQLGQLLSQLCVALTGQVHEVDLVELAAFSVQEMDVVALCNDLVPAGNALDFSTQPSPMTSSWKPSLMRGGATTRMLGSLPPQQSTVLHFWIRRSMPAPMQAAFALKRSFTSLVPSMMMSRSMTSWLLSRDSHAQSIHGLVDGIYKNGGAAGKALFGYQILVAQSSLQAAGPALVLVEADAAIGIVLGVGTITVGVGIAQAENMCFHLNILL